MSVLVQNRGALIEHVKIVDAKGNVDHATVQPNGRVTLPQGWRVAPTGVTNSALTVTGNDAPQSPLNTFVAKSVNTESKE